MRARSLLLAVLATAFALFVWQSLSNTLIPWHEATMRTFVANDSAVQAIRAHAPRNGVYFSPNGILAAVSLTPDLADKSQAMGPNLARQLALDVGVALLLALVVMRLPLAGAGATAGTFALFGAASAAVIELSNWNWYGFTTPFALVNVADHMIQWTIAGLVLGTMRMRDQRHAASDEGVRAMGDLPRTAERPTRV